MFTLRDLSSKKHIPPIAIWVAFAFKWKTTRVRTRSPI